jgi:hypothetical protein
MPDGESADNVAQGVRDAIIEASRVQLAAITAAGGFWSTWAEFTATYSQEMSEALKQAAGGESDPDAVVALMTDLNRKYLRQLTDLPEVAVKRFNEEVANIETLRAPRRRAGRAKE